MKVWSIRTVEELITISRGQPLRINPEKIDPHFKRAYQWIAQQLKQKISPPDGVEYPIWLWRYCYGKKRAMPDLRARCHIPTGQIGVRLELEMPEDQLLLSDFDGWHAVLNNFYHATDDADEENFAMLCREKDPHQIKAEIEKSWQKIFNVEHLPADYSVQAICWEIRPEHLRNYKIFVGR